ncbi:TetR family transcriptional regulator [Streptomyces fulvoviolaceus]|uniref:TetR family transcriptional regulator n=1 Tax=Streptomyces fulvoviolaceus TaxID=285535 RepID=UPI0004C82A2B|nr:TetR family transcriptional regulator [Streptomyces fulvoviolaceus]
METSSQEQVGARLRAARKARGMSLRALAGRIGVSPATMSQVELGRTGLSVSRLGEIARVLGTTVGDLIDGATPVAPPTRTPRQATATSRSAHAQEDPDWRSYPPHPFDPVLEAALAEFLEVGYHGTSVRGIAQRCGMSVAGLYHHYASKQEMLRRILDLTMTDLLRRSRAARAEGRGPAERFCLLVENLALFHTRRRELGFVGASEMRSLEPDSHRIIAGLRTEQQSMVDHEVGEAVAAGLFRTRHPHEAARAVVTMCTALSQWYRPGGELSPEGVAAEYVQFALDLMRFQPSQ